MINERSLEIIKLGVDHINKVPVANFSHQTRNEAIRDKFFEVMGTEKFDVMAYEAHKHEIFQIIRETLQQTIANGEGAMSAFYNQFVDEKNIAWGDDCEFDIENDAYLTVGKISGNNWELDRQRMDKGATISVPTSAYYIKVYEFFKRFMTGRMDFAELASKIDVSIKKHKDDFVAEVFSSAVNGLPTGFKYAGAYNEVEVQKVLTNVSAANEISVILCGTKAALAKLQGITATTILGDTQKAEYSSKGFIREWKGYICVELPTVFKANSITEFTFDNDTVYVLPAEAKCVKIVNEGTMIVAETNDIADRKDMTKEFACIWNMGGAAIFNRLIGALEITA